MVLGFNWLREGEVVVAAARPIVEISAAWAAAFEVLRRLKVRRGLFVSVRDSLTFTDPSADRCPPNTSLELPRRLPVWIATAIAA